MGTITRRLLFQRASIGVAAAGAIVAAPRLFADRAKPTDAARESGTSSSAAAGAQPTANGPVVAYVRDSAKGEVALYIGNREIIRRDPELVARLLQAGA
jgi:hypothetical protein